MHISSKKHKNEIKKANIEKDIAFLARKYKKKYNL